MSKKSVSTKTISFICNGFPIISETFITNNVISAYNLGYNTQIHADYQNNFEKNLWFNGHLLKNTIYLNQIAPSNKFERLVNALKLSKTKGALIPFLKSVNPLKFGSNGPNLRNFYSFTSFLESEKPDLIHAHFGPNGIKAVNARLSGLINCPIITSFHGYDAHAQESDIPVLQKKYSTLFDQGELFLVNSNFLRKQLEDLGCRSSKILKLPIGVDTKLFKPSEASMVNLDQHIKLISVGRLIPWKNQRLGIMIISWLRKAGFSASYTIIGSGPELHNLQTLANELGVLEQIDFVGHKSQDEIATILPKHHIFLMTSSYDDTGRTETQGVVTAEAQACGLPALVYGSGGTKETIKEAVTGFVIGDKSEKEVVKLISSMIQPNNFRQLSVNARRYIIENYNIEQTTRKLDEIYKSVLK